MAETSVQKINTIAFFTTSGDDAMAVLRVLGPANVLGLKVIKCVIDGVIQIDPVAECDLVVLQRDFPRHLDAYEKIVTLAHQHKKPIVMDMDDLLLSLPENHPDRISNFFASSLAPMLQAVMEADLVTVATPALQDHLASFNNNVKVFPNYLNDQLWKINPPAASTRENNVVSIGYMGGRSHRPDVQMVIPVLLNLIKKYPKRIQLKFWGLEPPVELAPYSRSDWNESASLGYEAFSSYFQTQAADIMIAPLIDSEFNNCKSSIKYLEYSAIGAPGVYSRLEPYESIVEHEVDGYLASAPDEWEECLSKLIEDPNLREKVALSAQDKLRKSWLLTQNADKINGLYQATAETYPTRDRQQSPIFSITKSIARQLFEDDEQKKQALASCENSIKKLENQLNEQTVQFTKISEDLQRRLNESEEEVVSYVTSTSWQITRPLRKISKMIRKEK